MRFRDQRASRGGRHQRRRVGAVDNQLQGYALGRTLTNQIYRVCAGGIPRVGNRPGAVGDGAVREICVGDIGIGDIRVGNVGIRDIRVRNIWIRDVRVGNVGIRDVRIGDIRVRNIRVGDVRVRNVRSCNRRRVALGGRNVRIDAGGIIGVGVDGHRRSFSTGHDGAAQAGQLRGVHRDRRGRNRRSHEEASGGARQRRNLNLNLRQWKDLARNRELKKRCRAAGGLGCYGQLIVLCLRRRVCDNDGKLALDQLAIRAGSQLLRVPRRTEHQTRRELRRVDVLVAVAGVHGRWGASRASLRRVEDAGRRSGICWRRVVGPIAIRRWNHIAIVGPYHVREIGVGRQIVKAPTAVL